MAVVTDLPDRLGVCWAGSLTSGDNGEALAQCIGVGRFDGGGEGGAGDQPDHAADLGALHCGHCVSGDVGGLPGVGGDLTDRGAHLDAGGMAARRIRPVGNRTVTPGGCHLFVTTRVDFGSRKRRVFVS